MADSAAHTQPQTAEQREWYSPCITHEDARLLRRLGFWLVPLAPRSKVPYTEMLTRGKWKPLTERRATEAQVLGWVDSDPSLNLGVFGGHGVVIVDYDHPELVPEDLDRPPTWTVKTGGEGRVHEYYRYDGPAPSRKIPFGDVIGLGKYAVAAGSTHPNGNQYEWAEDRAPSDLPLAAAPPWLRHLLEANTPPLRHRQQRPLEQDGARINTNTCSTISSRPLVRLRTASAREFEALARDPDVVFAVMRACGVEVDRLGKAFLCPMPGHEEGMPSAALWQDPNRPHLPIVLHDFHSRGREWVPIPDVYASRKLGKDITLTAAQRASWWIRALHEIGLVELDVPTIDLPEDAPKAAQGLLSAFLLLLKVRRAYNPAQPATAAYSWRFAAQWAGVRRMGDIQTGMGYLLRRGWLTKAETDHQGPMKVAFFELGFAALAALETVTITTAPEPITTQASPPAQLRPGHTMPSYKDNVLYLPSAGRMDAGRGWVDDARRARALH